MNTSNLKISRTLIVILCCAFTALLVGGFIFYKDRKVVDPEADILKLKYHKDSRTNICFVENNLYTNISSTTYTYVPCNAEVEALIEADRVAREQVTKKK